MGQACIRIYCGSLSLAAWPRPVAGENVGETASEVTAGRDKNKIEDINNRSPLRPWKARLLHEDDNARIDQMSLYVTVPAAGTCSHHAVSRAMMRDTILTLIDSCMDCTLLMMTFRLPMEPPVQPIP